VSTLQPPAEPSITTSGGNTNFDYELRHDRDAVWIRLGGELDLVSSTQLKQDLRNAVATQRLIVVDLRDLAFMDSAGLHAIVDADNRARVSGSRLVLIRGPAQIDRLFELVGVSDRLEIVDLGGLETPGARFRARSRASFRLRHPTPPGLHGERLPHPKGSSNEPRDALINHRRTRPSV
jgi:anti-sigma B factor antagonist